MHVEVLGVVTIDISTFGRPPLSIVQSMAIKIKFLVILARQRDQPINPKKRI